MVNSVHSCIRNWNGASVCAMPWTCTTACLPVASVRRVVDSTLLCTLRFRLDAFQVNFVTCDLKQSSDTRELGQSSALGSKADGWRMRSCSMAPRVKVRCLWHWHTPATFTANHLPKKMRVVLAFRASNTTPCNILICIGLSRFLKKTVRNNQ